MHAQDMLIRELRAAYAARARDVRRFWLAVALVALAGGGILAVTPGMADVPLLSQFLFDSNP